MISIMPVIPVISISVIWSVMVHACCWYRKPQECTGNQESEDVYDNPDDLTQWAHMLM